MYINKLKELGSVSGVTDRQFTLLRTYFPRRRAREQCEKYLVDLFGANKNYLDEANALLKNSPAFQNFLNKIGNGVHRQVIPSLKKYIFILSSTVQDNLFKAS